MKKKEKMHENHFEEKIKKLKSLLFQARECIDSAASVELEYANYDGVERLKALKKDIEEALTND